MGRHPFFCLWLSSVIITTSTYLVQAVSEPQCQKVAPQQKILDQVRTATISVPGAPFGLAYAKQKGVAFVSLNSKGIGALGVLNTSTFIPSLLHTIALPSANISSTEALGVTLSHNGRLLLIAAGEGAFIIDTAKAISGDSDTVVGTLSHMGNNATAGNAAIEVTLSLHDQYAFVSQEYGPVLGKTRGNVDVFKVHEPTGHILISGTPVGHLDLGYAVVGTALSPDGRTLYAVSEQSSLDKPRGALSVLDVETLKTNPRAAQISNVTAGCGPVRIIVSSDGNTIWITARESNYLLAYNSSKLFTDPSNALLAAVQVGTAPVGLTFARNESRILTADSNRFDRVNATSGLSVVDVEAALKGSNQAVLGRIPTGLFPREFTVSGDKRTILVADFNSQQIQAVDVSSLP